MNTQNFILAAAGHVDHGKTALIKALTGTDTDRLPEEKARGITIDLGFAHLALLGFSLGVIDVPGHEDFVRNMIAGVGSIDLALLVVAADDGWMPQTEEHLQILTYLGVQRMVVALTKADLGRLAERRREIREQLQGTAFAEAPIVETSIRDETGIAELRDALTSELGKLSLGNDAAKPRLFVDRVFSVRGSGTVVTGTLSGGQLTRGTNVRVLPQNLLARIRGVQSHNRALELAEPRTRTALNLAELSVEEVMRGSVITLPELGEPASVMDVVLERSGRLPTSARPLKSGATLNIHHGSGRTIARVQLRDRKELLPNEKAIARLRLRAPVFAFVGDRFIVRDASEQTTLAGGIVLDPDAAGFKFRSLPQRALLDARVSAPNDCANILLSALRRSRFAARSHLLLTSSFSHAEIEAALGVLQKRGEVFLGEKIVADAKWWQSLHLEAAKLIDREHAAHPEHAGLEMNRLREGLNLDEADIFDALLRDLGTRGFVQKHNFIGRGTHRPSLPPDLHPAGERIRAALRARPLDPPSRKELSLGAGALPALRFLVESGELISLGDDAVISAAVFSQLKTAVAQYLRARKSATVSELRQATGTTRRIIVPLLEQLDRLGLTIREGDRRRLR